MQINSPEIWKHKLPIIQADDHKYNRGHALIYGAPELTGATRLAASACAKAGAGLVTVLGGEKADIYRTTLPAHIMVRDDMDWDDDRISSKLYGSGGLQTDIDYKQSIPVILDADALKDLPNQLSLNYILTPHDGEFEKVFPDILEAREDKALQACSIINAIIVLKGPATIIAHPDGRIVINKHSSPYLASAGTGDVLAGMITGFCAQGMEPFYAACAAGYIHGDIGIRIGQGLVASDISTKIPEVLKEIT